jgi:uncharacterized protein
LDSFNILSLDGGGLKGIFTVSFLAFIEEQLDLKIIDHFDLITGTSTGGIIALSLGLGFSPRKILEFYLEEGHKIFPSQNTISRFFYSFKHFFRRKYSSEMLIKILQKEKYFGNKFLGHSDKRLIIPSFDAANGDVYIYKTAHHPNLKCDYKIPAWQVAAATASAPTFFPIFLSNSGVRLIDGGIWANNPTMVALAEALGYLDNNQENISILNIGTTYTPLSCSKFLNQGGLFSWSKKAVEFMMHGQDISAQNQAFHILGKKRYLRINPVIAKKYSMDKLYKELIGLGETEGRNRINEVNKMFLKHTAKPFKPYYST